MCPMRHFAASSPSLHWWVKFDSQGQGEMTLLMALCLVSSAEHNLLNCVLDAASVCSSICSKTGQQVDAGHQGRD